MIVLLYVISYVLLTVQTLSALLALCVGKSAVTGGSSSQKSGNTELWFFFDANMDKFSFILL